MATAPPWQPSLLGGLPPRLDPTFGRMRHLPLDGAAWVEHCPRWLQGHDAVFEALLEGTRWQGQRRQMYERVVDVPRLTANLNDCSAMHPMIAEMATALQCRYAVDFDRISLALYRDGRDSVAWHGDRVGRMRDHCWVATVSLGQPRAFRLRPATGGRSIGFSLGWGDLLVMGGSCQQTWQHCIPKVARAGPRICVMFRHSCPLGPPRRAT